MISVSHDFNPIRWGLLVIFSWIVMMVLPGFSVESDPKKLHSLHRTSLVKVLELVLYSIDSLDTQSIVYVTRFFEFRARDGHGA